MIAMKRRIGARRDYLGKAFALFGQQKREFGRKE